jgi:hypothetical protein
MVRHFSSPLKGVDVEQAAHCLAVIGSQIRAASNGMNDRSSRSGGRSPNKNARLLGRARFSTLASEMPEFGAERKKLFCREAESFSVRMLAILGHALVNGSLCRNCLDAYRKRFTAKRK